MRGFAKIVLASAACLSISGCAIPPALSIASLVADGASFMSSGKSVTDHGISAVFDEDCALLRIFDGEICRETPEYETAVATLQPQTSDPMHDLAVAGPVPVDPRAPILPVATAPLDDATPAAVAPVEIETLVVAASSVGDPLRLGPDPLRGLDFHPDRSFSGPAVRIGRLPTTEPWLDRASAALAGLHALGTSIEADG